MASLIFLIIGIEILVITLYRQLFYYFRVITSNTNTLNNDPTQNNSNNINNDSNDNNNNNNNNNNNDNDFNNNISKHYLKFRKSYIFCFHNFGGAIATQGVITHSRVRKGVIKLQQIISKHKQAYIVTAI